MSQRLKNTASVAFFALAPLLTGCLSSTRRVPVHGAPAVVQNATLEQLIARIDSQYNAIHSINASVLIAATTPGNVPGEVKDNLAFRGYIFIRKPEDLRVVLMVPVIGTRAMDMVSDGSHFTLLIPPRNRALQGTNVVSKPSPNTLENLRPAVFLDALLVRSIAKDEYISLTESSRLLEPETHHHEAIQEPDYDVTVLKLKSGNFMQRQRTVHVSRVDLQPYQQDIYDDEGRTVTTVQYSIYQKFGDLSFPTQIVIDRPLDHYTLKVTITKLTPNQQMDDDQFQLQIPTGITIQQLK